MRKPRLKPQGVHRKALGVAAQMHPAQAPGFVEMGVGALQVFAALAQQALPPRRPECAAGFHTRRRAPTVCPASTVQDLSARGVGLRVLAGDGAQIDTTNAAGRLEASLRTRGRPRSACARWSAAR